MSITRRILEGAQSGLSKLTSLVIVDDEPLSHVESAALQAELTARKAARDEGDARSRSTTRSRKLGAGEPGGARGARQGGAAIARRGSIASATSARPSSARRPTRRSAG